MFDIPNPRSNFWILFLALLIFILRTAEGTPLGTARAVTGGPLGSPVATPPGATPTVSALPLNNTQSANATVPKYQNGVRALDTILAVACVALTTTTYAVVIGPGTILLSTCKLPLPIIEDNIGNLLSKAWPDTSESIASTDPPESQTTSDAIRILYAGQMDDEPYRAARGVYQCEAKPDERISTPSMWLTTGSSLTKSVVQLAVWEWVCAWAALAMLISTLAFNGFFSSHKGPDAYPRLVVILIYAAAFCFHFWYVYRTFNSFFTLVIAGSTWSLLNKASFVSVELAQLRSRLEGDLKSPLFRELGKASSKSTYSVCPATLLQDMGILPVAGKEPLTDTQQSELKTVEEWSKRDSTSAVESGKSALDSIVANVMTMLGIVVATGFSAWTVKPTNSTVTSQLGSLGLLASLTLGAAAMFSSAIDLSVMLTSFRNLLFLKEVMLNGEASGHVQKRPSKKQIVGFVHKPGVQARVLTTRDLISCTNMWPLILFGPAFALLPNSADHDRQTAGAEFELCVKVRDKLVRFTTKTTDRHNKHPDGTNIGPINVCYEVTPPATKAQPHSQPRNWTLRFLRDLRKGPSKKMSRS